MISRPSTDAEAATVLIVAHDPAVVRIVEQSLGEMALPTAVACDGRTALEWLGRQPARLIVLDDSLTDASSSDLLETMSARNGQVPFVVLTALGNGSAGADLLGRGALGYAIKGESLAQLIGPVVRRAIDAMDRQRRIAELEQALHSTGDRFDAFMRHSPNVAFLKDEDGRMIYINPTFERIFHFDRVDWLGKNDFELWPPETARKLRENDKAVLASGQPQVLEEHVAAMDGDRYWHVVKFPFREPSGRICLGGLGVDITARKRAEEALRESQSRLARLQEQLIDAIESVGEGFTLYDANDRLVICNSRVREMYDRGLDLMEPGISFEEQIRKSAYRGQIADAAGREEEWIRERLGQHRDPKGSHLQRLADGRWLQITERRTRDGGLVIVRNDVTERKLAEEALRTSEQRLQTIVENMPVLLTAYEEDWRSLAWNRECERVTGYSAAEILARPNPVELLCPDPAYRRRMREQWLQRPTGFRDWEWEFHCKDGSVRTIAWSTVSDQVPIPGWTYWSVGVDVTERKRIEEALRRTNALLSALTGAQSKFIAAAEPAALFGELLAELLSLTDSQYGFIGEILRRDDGQPYLKAQAISNISWDQASREFYERFAPAGLEFSNLKTLFGAAITSGQPVLANDAAGDPRRGGLPLGHPELKAFAGLPIHYGETMIGLVGIANRPSGYDDELVAYLQPFLAACGSIMQARGHEARRVQAEQALRESEQRFRQLADSIDQVFWFAVARPMHVLYLSPAFQRVWGIPPEEVCGKGKTWLCAVHPEDREQVEEKLQGLVEGRSSTYEAEYRIVRPDGSVRWIMDHGTRVHDPGPLDRISGIARDITDRKRIAEESRQRQAELAHVMRLNELGKMVSELAHEVNQPLYAIANYASACSETIQRNMPQPDDELLRYMRQISEQANRAGEILRRIGRFVRNEPPQLATVMLDELLRGIVELVDIDARRHEFRLRLAFASRAPEVTVQQVQIEQVVVNLLLNAIDASKDLPPERREALIAYDCGPNEATISVRDRGRGVRAGDLPRLFEAFFTTKSDGMGMGLFISRSIIEAHGGRMWAVPNADFGMTFYFTLPLARKDDSHAG